MARRHKIVNMYCLNRQNKTYSSLRFLVSRHYKAVTGNQKVDDALIKVTRGRISHWLQTYEEKSGLAAVVEAQNNVLQAEKNFLDLKNERSAQQKQLTSIQSRLRLIAMEREKTNRVEERYLELVTQEHSIMRAEKVILDKISELETEERAQFSVLSNNLRYSHEKERVRAERTKYWGIFGSLIGATIGVVGATINQQLRTRHQRKLIKDRSEIVSEIQTLKDEVREILNAKLSDVTNKQPSGSTNACGCSELIKESESNIIAKVGSTAKWIIFSVYGGAVGIMGVIGGTYIFLSSRFGGGGT